MPNVRGSSSPNNKPRRGGGGGGSSSNSGWGDVMKKKKQIETAKKMKGNRPAYLDIRNKFMVKDEETVRIQILNDEPVCVDGCNIPGDFDFYVSRKNVDRTCPLVEHGLKPTFRAGFKVLDYRGKYDKDKRKHIGGEPEEKYWLVSNTVATQLHALMKRKGTPLTEMVLDVTRSGSDKNTTYNFEVATDRKGMVEPIEDYEETLPSLKKVLKPLSRADLEAVLGIDGDDDEDNKDDDDDEDDDD